MPIETPPVTPVATPTPAAPPPSDRQSKLDAILKAKPLPPEQQQALKDLFGTGDTNNTKIRGALDPLPLDNDSKNQIWKAYYSVDHPVPVTPKPVAPVLPAPPKPPVMLQENQPYLKHLTPAPLPPPPTPPGLLASGQVVTPKVPGNIKNLYDRKVLDNKDGTYSTTSSASFGFPEGEVLLPTVVDGVRLTNQQAIDRYRKTGEHLGIFNTPEEADAYAADLHNKQQAKGQAAATASAVPKPPQPAAMLQEKQPYMQHTTPAPLPPPPVPFATQFPGIPPSRPQGPLPMPAQPGWLDTLKGAPAAYAGVREERANKTAGQALRDDLATITKMGGGLLNAASANFYDPELGKWTMPVKLMGLLAGPAAPAAMAAISASGIKNPTFQVHRPLSQVLQEDWKVPADIAQNPDPAAVGKFVGVLYPWENISSAVSGAVGLGKAGTALSLVDSGVPKAAVSQAWTIANEILKHAGIQAATGEIYAHVENDPDNETPADRELRAGKTALYGAAFSVVFDSIAKLLAAAPRAQEGTTTANAQKAADDAISAIYDVFYKSGRFSDEASARAAASKVIRNQVGKLTPEEVLDASIRRFEAEKPPAETPEVPAVPKAEAKPQIPSVPEPTTNAPVPASAEGVEKPETPPKSVVPEEVGIKPPKKQFTHDGQYVVGTSEGKIVLADGSLVDRAKSYLDTLGKFGYPEITPEQIATLAGLAAAKEGASKQEPPSVPIAVPPPPLAEGATPEKATVEESQALSEPGVQKPFIGSQGAGPTLKDTRKGVVPQPPKPVTESSPLPTEPIEIPEKPGTYVIKNGKAEEVPAVSAADEKPVSYTDKSVQDHSQRVTIKGDTISIQHKVGKKVAGTSTIPLSEWLAAEKGPSANPNWNRSQVLKKHLTDVFATDESEPDYVAREAQADRLRDSVGYAIQKALALRTSSEPSTKSNLPAVPEAEGSGTRGQKWANGFDEDWYKSALRGPVSQYKPPESVIPTFEEVRDIYSKMLDLYPKHQQSLPDMLYDLIGRRMKKQPYPIELQGATKALGMPQPEDGEKLPPVPETEAKPEEETKAPAPIQSPRQETIERYRGLTDTVATILGNGESIDNPTLTKLANQAFGGERGAGKYDPRDAYDAVEAAINIVISKPGFIDFNDVPGTLKRIEKLESQIPRQADRTQEQVDFQQFSTPPAETFAAVLGAGIKPGMTVLEPSAGTGNIATMMKLAGAEVITNELAPRRQAILEMLKFPVHSVDAQYLDSLLPFSVIPDVVVMNPPFSSTGGRTKGHKTIYGAQHVEQALQRLKPGGRVVAIVGRGMAYGRPAFNDWWEKIEGKYTVRANIGISGKHYGKFGTGFDNQILVIDKTGPMSGSRIDRIKSVLTGEDLSPAQAADILGPLGKEDIAERILKHAKQAGVETTPGAGSRRAPGLPAPPAIDIHGAGGGGELGEGASGNGAPAGPAAVGAVERPDVPVPAVGGEGAGVRHGEGGQPGAVESGGTANVGSGSGSGEPAGTGGDAGLARGEINESKSESEGSVFSKYVIRKATFAGSKPHPANIVESATMSSVDPPDVTYTPKIPPAVVKAGKLSDVQLEAITYAGQKHSVKLPSGKRAGYWIGDGTGVGKGREIAGVFYDNLMQGKKRGIWFSATAQLKVDALRDMLGIDLPMDLMIQQDSDMDAAIPDKDGIVFSTYSLASHKWDAGKPRLEQLSKWAGENFDGVIVFDESHLMKNAVMANQGGVVANMAPGKQEGTNSGAMGLALDDKFPNAKIVYVSATGATVPRNMGYMSRLGLWGPGAPFPSFVDFLGAMADGGVGAMEMLSRDLKATGSYIGRSISYTGVDYGTVEHELNDDEVANYNDLADVWSEVMQAFGNASANAGSPKNAKGAISAYYSSQQRFFLQVQTALQLSDLFQHADRDLKEGRSVVVSIYNTNEGQVAKKVAAAKADGVDLEDLDFTPREILIDLVGKYFPVEQWTTKFDPLTQKDVPVQMKDEAGNPIINRENAAMRDALLDKIADIRVPDNPLDAIVNHFGPKNVAEVTGRKKRLEGGKYVARKIKDVPLKERDAMEVKRFQSGQVRVAVISGKASAGISLHASKGEANQDRRVFYAMQLSWSADKQMQSFGRVHRSDQVQPPIIKMVLTNLKGQQRLVNTVAMRLASLGALTEGSRESKGGGLFSLHDITDEYGIAALGRTYADVNQDRIKGIKAGPQMIQRMGLADKNGNIRDSDLANVERFLNRIMALHVDEQNAVFNHFYSLFEQVVKDAKAAGKFDEGVTKLPAENIIETEAPQLIYTDPNSGARTSLMTFSGEVQSTRMAWDEFQKIEQRAAVDIPRRATGFYRNKRSGRLYGTIESKPKDYGETDFRLYSANSGYSNAVGRDDLVSNFEPVSDGVAANEWNDQYKKVPEKVSKQFSLINGAIFPIYDKVMGADGLKNPSVVRAELANGKSRIGILVQGNEIESLKQRLGIGTPLGQATPKQVYDLAKNHSIIELDNGWEIKTSRVHGETRIEINPGQRRVNKEEMDKFGVISERIDYTNRYFIPLDDDSGPLVVGNILKVHKAVRDKTAITSVEDKPSKTKASEKAPESSGYVIEPTVPEPVKPPVKMGRDYKFPDQKPQVLLKPPVVVGDRTYEPTIIKRSDVKGKAMEPLSGWEVSPGLGVAESLDKPGQFEVTHTVSGLRVADAFDLKRAVAIAEKLSEMGDWTRSVEGLTSDKPFAQAVQAEIKRFAAERGSFSLFKVKPPQKIPNSAVETPQKNIQKLFDTQETISSAWETVKDLPARVKRTMVDPFIYNKDIEMWPIFAEMVRRFQENPSDAATQSAQKIEQILHGMDNSEFQVFSKIVYLEDLYESAVALGEDSIPVRPDPTTNRSVIDSIDEEITRLRNYVATPAVLASVDRHHVWMQEIWDDLVRRGKVDGDGGRVKYYPNYIRRFGEGMDNVLGLPYRMKDPKRMYLKERKGHLQIHDSNYVRVMEQYATRVFIDNSIDDFIQAVAETYDLRTGKSKEVPQIQPADLKKLLPKALKPGDIIELPDGTQFSVYQFSPGRIMYPVRVINDYVIQDAINSGVDELGIDIDKLRQAFSNGQSGVQSPPQLETVDEFGPGDELTRPGLIMGGQHKMYILPREISSKLMRFRDASNPNPLSELARVATKAFKVLALHSNVLSWQGQNVFSNNIMAAVEDINILGRQKEALQMLRGKLTGPQYDTLLSLIHDARVWNSTFLGTGGTIGAAINRPGLRPYRAGVTGAFSKLNPFGDTPLGDFWRAYEGKLRMVEAITKVASFLENHDRVMHGLPVKHVAVDLGGLDPTSVLAVGRVARELNGDYGATNKAARPIQTLLLPFSTWYIRIIPQVIRALRHKVDPKADAGLLLMAGLFIAAYMWNHLHHWETEKKLDWQKEVLHIDTGVFDEKGNPYIWSEQTPFDAALQVGGLHTFSSNLDRVMSGEWTFEQAAKKQLGDMLGFQDQAWLPTAPGAMVQQLLNPMIGVLTEMASNRDAMSGAEIVKKSNPNQWGTLSKRMPDNPVGVRLMEEYYGKRLISPYMQALRAEQMNDPNGPLWNWITEGPLSWKKLLGIRTANLDSLDMAKWYDDKNWEQSLLDTHSKELIDTFIQFQAGNLDAQEYTDRAIAILQKDGPAITVGPSLTAPVPGYDLYRMTQTNAFKLQVDKALLGKATDQKQRDAIIEDMKSLEDKLRMESYTGAPKAMKQNGPNGLPYIPQPPVPNQAPRTIPLVPIPPEPAPAQ